MKLKKLIKIAMGLAAARAAAKGGRGYGRAGYGGYGGYGYGYRKRKPSMKARIFQMILSRLARR